MEFGVLCDKRHFFLFSFNFFFCVVTTTATTTATTTTTHLRTRFHILNMFKSFFLNGLSVHIFRTFKKNRLTLVGFGPEFVEVSSRRWEIISSPARDPNRSKDRVDANRGSGTLRYQSPVRCWSGLQQ